MGMTALERKRWDTKQAAKKRASAVADKKKKDENKIKKEKTAKILEEGKAYGKSRGKVQSAIREKQREGLSYSERKELREKLAKRPSYGKMESGTYRTTQDIRLGQGAEPTMTYSKGDRPVKKKVAPTKKTVIKKGGKNTYKSKNPTTRKKIK
tara:strand:+ start:55 stop:513 length:459 start_codon:yes stop_codon:yes gene_type:complete